MWKFKRLKIILLFVGFLCSLVIAADLNSMDKLVNSELDKKAFQPNAKTRILLITNSPDHPYLTHMYLHESCLLAKYLRQNSGVDTVVSYGWPEDEKVFTDADAIAMYSGQVADRFLKDKNAVKQLQKHADSGKGIVGLHWATGALHKEDKEKERGLLWLGLLGCVYDSSESGHVTAYAKVKKLDDSHPISKGWMDFLTYDEYYLNMKTVKGALPVVKVEMDNGKEDIVAWYFQRPDGGRSYANTLGHFHYNFANPSFLKMYLNGILWTAKYEIPDTGAQCQIKSADMHLPPEPENYWKRPEPKKKTK